MGGKSTAAQLSAAYRVLNDEMSLVSFTEDGVILHGTPFNGYFKDKHAGCAPLRAVLLLHKGPEHRLADVKRSDAAATIVKEIVPPMGLEEGLSGRVYETMLTYADRTSS